MGDSRRFPRTARVNEVLREVIAETLEHEIDQDDRLGFVTVTSVEAEPDLRHARVFYTSLGEDVADVLEEHRIKLQSAIGRQVRMKRTPQLIFSPDPSLEEGWRIENIVRSWHENENESENARDNG
jgi:ribosome-binding factor A